MAKTTKEPVKRKGKKKRSLNDAEFLKFYFELNEAKSELARRIGVSPGAITHRLKKIGVERIEEARRNGATAFSVAVSVDAVKGHQESFNNGVQRASRILDTMEHLATYLDGVDTLYNMLVKEVKEYHSDPKKKIKPYHIDMLTKLTQQGSRQIEVIHKIRKDMFDIDGTMRFFHVVVQVMEEEIPDVQSRLYRKLAALGAPEQLTIIYPATSKETGEPPED